MWISSSPSLFRVFVITSVLPWVKWGRNILVVLFHVRQLVELCLVTMQAKGGYDGGSTSNFWGCFRLHTWGMWVSNCVDFFYVKGILHLCLGVPFSTIVKIPVMVWVLNIGVLLLTRFMLCSLQMITKNFEDYPEHRLKFFSLLRAIASHCFRALFSLSSQVSMSGWH